MRRRVFIVVGLTFLAMVAIMSATIDWIVWRGIRDLESRSVSLDVERVRGAIGAELGSLDRTATDWSAWDATYEFAVGLNPSYVEENLDPEMLARLGLGSMLLVETGGRPVYGLAVDTASRASLGFPISLAQFVADHPEWYGHADRESSMAAVELLPEGPALLASRPILDNRRTQPIRGALVMARPLDAVLVKDLNRQTSLSFTLLTVADPSVPSALADRGQLIVPIGGERIAIYAPLARSGDRTTPIVLRLEEPAAMRTNGRVILATVGAGVVLAGICFLVVTLVFLEREVLSRLHRLSNTVLAIGTSDDPSRRVDARGRDEIGYLGAAINGMLESVERSTADLRRAEARGEAFLGAVPDMFFRVTRDGTIVDARLPAGLAVLPPTNQLIGTVVAGFPERYSVVKPAFIQQGLAAIEAAIATGMTQTLVFSLGPERGGITYECRIAAAGADEVIALVRDITERELAEEARRKGILLREIHHRVKNNLQVITSLLALQARSAGDPRLAALLTESRTRVRSIAMIHEKLYEAGSGRVGFADYVRDLVDLVRTSWTGGSGAVDIEADVEDVSLDLDVAVPCGLVINELLSNALQHGFPAGRQGVIRVSLVRSPAGPLRLEVSDNGVGVPGGVDLAAPSSLGLRIITIMAEQLRGTLRFQEPDGGGASFTLEFAG